MEKFVVDESFDVAQLLVNLPERVTVRNAGGQLVVSRGDNNREVFYVFKSEIPEEFEAVGRIQPYETIYEVVYEKGKVYVVCKKQRYLLEKKQLSEKQVGNRVVIERKVFETLRDYYIYGVKGQVVLTKDGVFIMILDGQGRRVKEAFSPAQLPVEAVIITSMSAFNYILKMPGELVMIEETDREVIIRMGRHGYLEKREYKTEGKPAHGWGLFITIGGTYYTPFRVDVTEGGLKLYIMSKYGVDVVPFNELLEYHIEEEERFFENVIRDYKYNRDFIKLLHAYEHEIVLKLREKFLETEVSKIDTKI